MSDYRYIATHRNGDGTETPISYSIPLQGAQITNEVSAPGGLTGTISPEIVRLQDEKGEPVFKPWATSIYAEQDGYIRGGGILAPLGVKGSQLTIDCIGDTGYIKGIPYMGNLSRIGVDPLDMARHIWEHAQAQKYGNLGVVLDNTTSPVRIGKEKKEGSDDGPYKLHWFQNLDLGEEFDKLAESTPFEYRMEHSWSGENIRHFIRLGYPRLGRRLHDLSFIEGVNVFSESEFTFGGDDFANEVIVLGAGEGRKMVRGFASRVPEGLRRVAIVTDKNIRSKEQADKRANRSLRSRLIDAELSDITVVNHPNAKLGTYTAGDEILVQTTDGWLDSTDIWCRILSITISPEEGTASLQIERV